MSHQDWKPIIWQKNIPTKELPKTITLKNTKKNSNLTTNTITKIYNDDNLSSEPDIKPVLIDKNLAKEIQTRRLLKNISQQQLANALSIPVSVINEYEKGIGIRNGNYVSKIKKYLNI